MTQNLPCLRTLNIQTCETLTIKCLSFFAEYCNNLKVLYVDITEAHDVTERIVSKFSQACTRLTYLSICSSFVLCSTTCTASLLKGCPALQTLVINKYENIAPTTRELCAIVKPQLKILVQDESTEYDVLAMPI